MSATNFDNLKLSEFWGAGFEQVDPKKVADGVEKALGLGLADPFAESGSAAQ